MTLDSAPRSSVFEAKYCEGCGAIRLRPAATTLAYCRDCLRRLGDLPQPSHPPAADEGRRS
ncbi:MAG: hypothetical protein ACRD2R_08650, partial [Terriglobales bacterium]